MPPTMRIPPSASLPKADTADDKATALHPSANTHDSISSQKKAKTAPRQQNTDNPVTERENFLSKLGGPQKTRLTPSSSHHVSSWSSGMEVACQVVDALMSENGNLQRFLKTIAPLKEIVLDHWNSASDTMMRPTQHAASPPREPSQLIADLTRQLQKGYVLADDAQLKKLQGLKSELIAQLTLQLQEGPALKDGTLLEKLEELKKGMSEGNAKNADSLGFFTVMVAMASVVKIAELMKNTGSSAGTLINGKAMTFIETVGRLLHAAFPASQFAAQVELAKMVGGAFIKVPFEFDQAHRALTANLVTLLGQLLPSNRHTQKLQNLLSGKFIKFLDQLVSHQE